MLELEVHAVGLRDLNKILELDYLELDQPTITFREIPAIFGKLGLDPCFVGAILPELRPKTKTRPLNV